MQFYIALGTKAVRFAPLNLKTLEFSLRKSLPFFKKKFFFVCVLLDRETVRGLYVGHEGVLPFLFLIEC